jgi:hypothetical protein
VGICVVHGISSTRSTCLGQRSQAVASAAALLWHCVKCCSCCRPRCRATLISQA